MDTFEIKEERPMWKSPMVIIIGIVVVLALWLGGVYNGMVRSGETVDTAWAQVETQYQRRFDLIPNLVAIVQGAMKQEQEIFIAIANARQGYAGARTVNEKVAAATQVESAFGRLLMIMENYPQLKSIDTMQTLLAQLEGTENRVSVERGRFNETVRDYNIKVKTFPNSVVASSFGFTPRIMFEAQSEAATAPKVAL